MMTGRQEGLCPFFFSLSEDIRLPTGAMGHRGENKTVQ